MFAAPLILLALCGAMNDVVALNPERRLSQYVFETWNAEHGLPQNTVNAITQSPDGFLWVGTYEGLARFDGTRIEALDGALQQQIGNAVAGIWIAPDGAMWIGSMDHGLSRLKHGEAQHWSVKSGLPTEAIQCVAGRSADDVYIGTAAGLRRWHQGRLEPVPGVPDVAIRDIAFAADGRRFIATRNDGLFVLHTDEHVERHRVGPQDALLSVALPAPDGSVWLGGSAGLFRLEQGQIRPVITASGPVDAFINTLLLDDDGNLWIGTEGQGLLRLRGSELDRLGTEQGLPSSFIRALHQDANGSLWFGSTLGLSRLRDGLFINYGRAEGMAGEYARVVTEGADGAIYAGLDSGGLVRIALDGEVRNLGPADGLLGNTIRSLAVAADGALWLAAYDQGLQRYQDGRFSSWTPANGLPNARIRAMLAEPDGRLWLGTEGAGLVLFQNGRFRSFGEADGLSNADVRALLRGRDGRLWIGTHASGLVALQHDRFSVYSEADGLPSIRVLALHEDRRGLLWIGTQSGLARYDGRSFLDLRPAGDTFARAVFFITEDLEGALWFTGNLGVTRVPAEALSEIESARLERLPRRHFETLDGLRSAQINGASQPAGALGRDGRLWFPTARGIAVLDPRTLSRPESKPRVSIEAVLVQGQPVPLPRNDAVLDLPPGADRIEVRYAGVHELMPHTPLFQTLLEGLETQWSSADERRNVYYAALPPGDYRLRVRAVTRRGTMSDQEAQLAFHIERRLSQKLWFQALLVIGAGLLLFGAFVLRTWRLRQINQMLAKEIDAHTTELRKKNLALQEALEEVQRISHTDSLTGARNRRFLEDTIRGDLAQALRRYRAHPQQPPAERERLVFMMVDIDHFKEVNDTYGHPVGDKVLQSIADALRETIRESDLLVRWGGEEFLVLARFAGLDQAMVLAERMVKAVAARSTDIQGRPLRRTCSIGIAGYPFLDAAPEQVAWVEVIDVADCALYLAKHHGRNRWVALSPLPEVSDPDLPRRLARDPQRTLAEGSVRMIESGEAGAAPGG